MTAAPADLWAFEGRWTLRRDITDRRAGQAGHASGVVEFRAGGEGLIHIERIRLHLPGQPPLDGSRRYIWRVDGTGIAVSFEDGREFHRIDLRTATAQAAHWCDPDQYDVRYDFARWPRWSSIWEVRGPRKDYRMQTSYAPLDEPGTA